MRDPQYRVQYQVRGHWTGSIAFTKHLYQIKPIAHSSIQRLDSQAGKIKFKEFANLRTGRRDGFSRLRLEQLKTLIGPSDFDDVHNETKEYN